MNKKEIQKLILKYKKQEERALNKMERLGIFFYGKEEFYKRFPSFIKDKT